jgi:hypothetical protein
LESQAGLQALTQLIDRLIRGQGATASRVRHFSLRINIAQDAEHRCEWFLDLFYD